MPSNTKQVTTAVNVMNTILGMGSSSIGHVQLPAFQKQAKQSTIVNHRRTVEEMLLKAGLTVDQQIVLLFDKSNCAGSDARSAHQYCIATYHKQFTPVFEKSEAFQSSRVGPLHLLPVSEFYGYDDTAKPGPAERAETNLDSSLFFGIVSKINEASNEEGQPQSAFLIVEAVPRIAPD